MPAGNKPTFRRGRAMQQSLAARSLARHRAAGGPAARQGRLRGLGCGFCSCRGRAGKPAQAGVVAQPPGAGARRPQAPAAVGAAFSRQLRDFYIALPYILEH
jgi:hypothetical protein